jgi:ribosomal protein L5
METLDEYIQKFQEIYQKEFGEEIFKEEAYDNFMSLLNLLRIVLRPLPIQSHDNQNPGSVSSPIDQISGDGKLKKHNN